MEEKNNQFSNMLKESPINLYDFFAYRVKNDPERQFIWFLGKWFSYGQIMKMVDQFAANLFALGVKKYTTVAIHLPNCPQYYVAVYALYRLGARPVTLNPIWKNAEIFHVMKLSKAQYYIGLDQFYTQSIREDVSKTNFRLQDTDHKILIKKFIITHLTDLLGEKYIHTGKFHGKIDMDLTAEEVKFSSLLKDVDEIIPKVEMFETDLIHLMRTYTSEGIQKIAGFTSTNIFSQAKRLQSSLNNLLFLNNQESISKYSGVVGIIPIFNTYGFISLMILPLIFNGHIILFQNPPKTPFLINILEKEVLSREIMYPGTSILFQRLTDEFKKHRISTTIKSTLKLCFTASNLIDIDLYENFEKYTSKKLFQFYGISEIAPFMTIDFPKQRKVDIPSIGFPVEKTEIGIFRKDIEGITPVSNGNIGEIAISGPHVFQEYFGDLELTKRRFKEYNKTKWFLTGIMAYADTKDMFVLNKDLRKKLIIHEYFVYPREIEQLFQYHPDIQRAKVDLELSSSKRILLKAQIQLKKGTKKELNSSDITKWCERNMCKHKIPEKIEILSVAEQLLVMEQVP